MSRHGVLAEHGLSASPVAQHNMQPCSKIHPASFRSRFLYQQKHGKLRRQSHCCTSIRCIRVSALRDRQLETDTVELTRQRLVQVVQLRSLLCGLGQLLLGRGQPSLEVRVPGTLQPQLRLCRIRLQSARAVVANKQTPTQPVSERRFPGSKQS